jgi:hypothetical protein
MSDLASRLSALENGLLRQETEHTNIGFAPLDLDAAWEKSLQPKQYVVDEWAGKVGTSLWVAPPKTGKSTLTRALCAHVQNGLPFGVRQVTPGNALYLSTQEAAEDIIAYFRRYNIGPKMGEAFQKNHLPTIIGKAQFFKARTLKDRAKSMLDILNDELSKHCNGHYSFVVTDMLLDIAEIQETNSASEANERLSVIASFAEAHQTHIAPVYHANKRDVDMGESDPLMSVSGANSLAGGVDDVFIFVKKGQGEAGAGSLRRWITSVGRFSGGDNPWRELLYERTTGLVSIGQTWSQYSGDPEDGGLPGADRKATAANRDRKEGLLATLKRLGATELTPMDRITVFTETKGNGARLLGSWRELLSEGLVDESANGGRSPLCWSVIKNPLLM